MSEFSFFFSLASRAPIIDLALSRCCRVNIYLLSLFLSLLCVCVAFRSSDSVRHYYYYSNFLQTASQTRLSISTDADHKNHLQGARFRISKFSAVTFASRQSCVIARWLLDLLYASAASKLSLSLSIDLPSSSFLSISVLLPN